MKKSRAERTLWRLVVLIAASSLAGCRDMQPMPVGPSPVASRLTLTASPSAVLLSGSTVTLSAQLLDANGARVPDALLRFATNTGSLSRSDGVTNANGDVALTLTASAPATVSATGPGVPQVSTTITAVAPFTLTVVAPGQTFVDDTPIDVAIIPTTALGAAPSPATVTVRCGTAAAQALNGAIGTLTSRCSFPGTGPQTITATATTANGWSTSASLRVTANARPTPPQQESNAIVLRYRRTQTTRTSVTVEFTVSTTGDTAHLNLTDYQWDFGDGSTNTSSSGQIDHTYATPGDKDVSVAVRERNGPIHRAHIVVPIAFDTGR